ncbi:MAG: 2-oxoisovalerate dehydrogenase [bacterium]|nr:2-oxoisovalerate dehydrogenase [bacterium]
MLRAQSGGDVVSEIIFLIEESADGGYEARALGASIFTEAETVEALKDAVRDAVRCHFSEEDRPRVIRLHLVRDELIPA